MMTTQRPSDLARRLGLSEGQLETIRRMAAHPDAPDDVLELLIAKCRAVGCDPLDKLIYVIPRRQNVKDERTGEWRSEIRWTIQGSIDLFRSIAEQSGDYAGQRGPFWSAGDACKACDGKGVIATQMQAEACYACDGDGKQWERVWLGSTPPAVCKIGVLRNSFKEPLWVTGTYEYYVPRDGKGIPAPSNFWKGEKGAHQLAKCTEELALRKAFPRRLGGVYGTDEMQQAGRPAPLPKRAHTPVEAEDVPFKSLPAESVSHGTTSAPVSSSGRSEGDTTAAPPLATVQSRSAKPDEYRRKTGMGEIEKLYGKLGWPQGDERRREALIQLFGVERFTDRVTGECTPTRAVLDVSELERYWLALNERTKATGGDSA